MSTTTTTTGVQTRYGSAKHYTILIALVLALAAGVFGAYSLTSSEPATTAPSATLIEDSRAGGGCSASFTVAGGVIEGRSLNNTCGEAGGSSIRSGVQP